MGVVADAVRLRPHLHHQDHPGWLHNMTVIITIIVDIVLIDCYHYIYHRYYCD